MSSTCSVVVADDSHIHAIAIWPNARRYSVALAKATAGSAETFGADLGFAHNRVLKGTNAFTLSIGPLVSWSFPNQAIARARIAQTNAAAGAALATRHSAGQSSRSAVRIRAR